MTDDKGCRKSVSASTGQAYSDSNSKTFNCYKCSGPNHMGKDCMQECQERSDSLVQKFHREKQCFMCDGLGHVSSECLGNTQRGGDVSAFLLPKQVKNKKLPAIKVFMDG